MDYSAYFYQSCQGPKCLGWPIHLPGPFFHSFLLWIMHLHKLYLRDYIIAYDGYVPDITCSATAQPWYEKNPNPFLVHFRFSTLNASGWTSPIHDLTRTGDLHWQTVSIKNVAEEGALASVFSKCFRSNYSFSLFLMTSLQSLCKNFKL